MSEDPVFREPRYLYARGAGVFALDPDGQVTVGGEYLAVERFGGCLGSMLVASSGLKVYWGVKTAFASYKAGGFTPSITDDGFKTELGVMALACFKGGYKPRAIEAQGFIDAWVFGFVGGVIKGVVKL